MATTSTPEERSRTEVVTHPRERAYAWGIPMTIGILLIIGGLFALYAAALTSLVSVVFLGILLLAAGILEIVAAFRGRHQGRFLVYFLAGLLTAVVGALFLFRPLASVATLTLLIAGYLFASGLFRGITSIVDRYPGWGWDLLYGIVALALGAIVLAQWPASSLWVVGTVVAAEIIARGITLCAASLTLREVGRIAPGEGYAAPA